MVSIVKTDRIRSHISIRGLEGRSLERERGDDRRISVHDRLGGRVSMHDRLGGRTMLCDPAGGRISADEQVERAAATQVPDEYPHRRDLEREPVHDNIDRLRWCPKRFDQVTEETSSEAASDRGTRGRGKKRGSQERSQI